MRLGVHGQVVLKQSEMLIPRLGEEAVSLGAVRHIVTNNAIVRAMHHHSPLECVMIRIVPQVSLVEYIHSPSWRKVVPMRRIPAEVRGLARAEVLSIFHTHLTTEKHSHVRAEHEGVSCTRRSVVALDFDVPREQADRGPQIRRTGNLLVEPPLAEVHVAQRRVHLNDEAILVQRKNSPHLLGLAAVRRRDDDAGTGRPIHGLLEAQPGRPGLYGRHQPGPRDARLAMQVQLAYGADVARRGALAVFAQRQGVAPAVEAA
mmetsp:Transcript_66858/g.204745  ORF Transcript_66858/g.204745 Transcript_66858/m.204745 type:complete len:260 (+) Transcript_66858:1833-2612(+)